MNYIIGLIAKPLGELLYLIYQAVGNYGVSLIILTIIVRCALYPLYAMQIKSTAAMTKIQPKMKQIQQKYSKDRETMSIKLQELYKEEGVHPAAGCLPMLIQMPIIFGLFALLRDPLTYISNENMLFGIHESFLWIPTLSQADPWILPILAGLATFISFSLSMKQQGDQVEGMGGAMKAMRYVFPVLIVMMGRSFPGGLTIYWFFGQFLQIFFNLHLNKVKKQIIDDDKKVKKRGKRK